MTYEGQEQQDRIDLLAGRIRRNKIGYNKLREQAMSKLIQLTQKNNDPFRGGAMYTEEDVLHAETLHSMIRQLTDLAESITTEYREFGSLGGDYSQIKS